MCQADILKTANIVPKMIMDKMLQNKKFIHLCALYNFLYYTGKWQETNRPYAVDSFCAEALNISPRYISTIKKELKELGLIKQIRERRPNGTYKKPYVEIVYMFGQDCLDKNVEEPPSNKEVHHSALQPHVDTVLTNALSTISLNASSAVKDSKESYSGILKNTKIPDRGKNKNSPVTESKKLPANIKRKRSEIQNEIPAKIKSPEKREKSEKKLEKNPAFVITPRASKFIEYWNSLPKVPRQHSQYKKNGDILASQSYKTCLKNFNLILSDGFYDDKSWDEEWIAGNNIKFQVLDEEMIYSVLDDMSLIFQDGYAPERKDKIKKWTLNEMLYNPRSGKSIFWQCAFNKPKPLKDKTIKDEHPILTALVLKKVDDISSNDTQKMNFLISGIQSISNYNKSLPDIPVLNYKYPQTTPRPFLIEYIDFIERQRWLNNISYRFFNTKSKIFNKFLTQLEEDMEIGSLDRPNTC